MNSFYVTGGTLRYDAPSYVERQADRDLFEGLLARRFCYVLTSRQMGKSSLMVRTANRLREKHCHVVALDLTALGQNCTAEQWYDGLMMRMGRQLRLEDECEQFWQSHGRLTPIQRLFDAIRDLALPCRPGPLVIFVDEIDTVRSLPFSTDEFFAAIRESYNRRSQEADFNRVTFCLLGVASPSDLIRDTRTTPFNVGSRIELNDFTPEEAAPLAEGLVAASEKKAGQVEALGPRLLERILYWTAGHPFLTQRLCRAVAEANAQGANSPNPVLNWSEVDRLCNALFLSGRARERDDNLLFVRERLLHSEVDRAAILDLYRQILKGKAVPDDETNALVTALRLSGITRVEQGRLRVRNRIYARVFDQRWVAANVPEAELLRQQKAFRKGLIRATSIAAVVVAIMGWLVLFAKGAASKAKRQAARAEELYQRLGAVSVEALLAQTRSGRFSGMAGQRFEGLYPIGKAVIIQHGLGLRTASEALRNEAIACLVLTDLQAGKSWEARPSANQAVAVSSDLQWYARSEESGSIDVREIDTNAARWTLPAEGVEARAMMFSPARDFLAVHYGTAGSNYLALWSLSSGRKVYQFTNSLSAETVDFSADDRQLAVAMPDSRVEIFDLSRKQVVAILQLDHLPSAVRFHPNGNDLAVGSLHSLNAQVLHLPEGTILKTLDHPNVLQTLAWNADGTVLATACTDRRIYLWDLASPGGGRRALEAHEAVVTGLAFSHAGDLLASHALDKTARLWDPSTGRALVTLPDVSYFPDLRFSPDDGALAFQLNNTKAQIWNVAHSRECRIFHDPADLTETAPQIALSQDGQLLASTSPNGIVLWDVAAGRKMATVPVRVPHSIVFHPRTGDLLSSDLQGLHRFLSRTQPSAAGRIIQLGPAKTFPVSPGARDLSLTADGKLLAASLGNHLLLVDPEVESKPIATIDQTGLGHLTLSPNRQWLAGSMAAEGQVRIWNVLTMQVVTNLALSGPALLAFSSDNHWLVTGTESEYRFWETGPWRMRKTIVRGPRATRPGPAAFSGNSELLAIAIAPAVIQLLHPATFEPIAQLEAPHHAPLASLQFSADGSKLAASAQNQLIFVWDLAWIRAQLAALGLAWESPLGLAKKPPLDRLARVEIEAGALENPIAIWEGELKKLDNEIHLHPAGEIPRQWRAFYLRKLNRFEEAIEEYRKCLQLNPTNAQVCRELAYTYLNGPAALRSIKEARTMASRALELEPENYYSHYYWGMALYRSGQYLESIETLEKAAARVAPGSTTGNLFFQAMNFARLGNRAIAKQRYDEAMQVWRKLPPGEGDTEGYAQFQAEADDLLGK